MNTHPNLNNDPELLNIKTGDDEIKDLRHKSEKYDYDIILKSLKVDIQYYKKKYKNLTKKKVLLMITEMLLGSGSALTT